MSYVDGFVLPVASKHKAAYLKIARVAGKIWTDLGALEYRECVSDDINAMGMITFPQLAKTRKGEIVVFAWIVFKSKAHRDQVNKKVMKDKRMQKIASEMTIPFDMARMAYGGFKLAVNYPIKKSRRTS